MNIPPFTDAATIAGWTREAEQAGWDGVFLWDHIQWNPGVAPLDPWVLLGAMAQVTERVRLGTLVTPLSRRRPQVMAKHLTTLDHLSGGRADGRVRATMLDESLAVIDQLFQGPTQHAGEHYQITADLHPRPVQQPRPPIWVAGIVPNRRPLARARRWDGAIPIGPGDHLTPEELAAHLASDGHPTSKEWDVVVIPKDDVPVQEYADAGATWLVHTVQPTTDDWQATMSGTVRNGPHRD